MTNNERVIAQARAHAGLEAGNPAHRSAWLRLLGPGTWPLDKPYGAGGISLCAVVAIGLLRLAGAKLAQLAYRTSAGLIDQIRRAKDEEPYGAWFDATLSPTLRPEPGDVVEVLHATDPKGSTHVLTCIGWEGDYLLSVDGGQVDQDDGLQAIYVRRRLWRVVGGRPYLGDLPVHGWIAVRLVEFEPEPE